MIDVCFRTVFEEKVKQLFDDLRKREQAGELVLSKYSYLFVPYIGRGYWMAPKRILLVGRSVDGWDDFCGRETLEAAVEEEPSIEKLVGITMRYIEGKVIPDYARPGRTRYKDDKGNTIPNEKDRHIFHVVFQLAPYIMDGNPVLGERPDYTKENSERCFYSFAWSNLCKIGFVRGNPDEDMMYFQIRSFNTLRKEIECLEPDIIIFMTGWYKESDTGLLWDRCLRDTFSASEVELRFEEIGYGIPEIEIARVRADCINNRVIMVRTSHPQGWRGRRGRLKSLYEYLRKELDKTS